MREEVPPRTTLEAIKRDRGMTWRDVARAIERAGHPASTDHVQRLGTGKLDTRPQAGLARAMEQAFQLPLHLLLGPNTPATATSPGAGITTHQEALAMAADKARRLGLNMPALEDYTLLEEELRDLAQAYPVTPLPELINPLVNLQDAVHEAVLNPKNGDGTRLYGITAITGGLLAKASHDLGDTRTAATQARTAIMFADQLGHATLKAWLDGLMALITYWDDRPRDSLRHIQRGLAATSDGSPALWLHSSAARAWARLGNTEDATAAVHRAEDVAEAMEHTDLDDYGGLLTFTPARAAYYAADAYAWLPGHPDGERVAADAVDAYADPNSEDWAFGDAAGAVCALAIARVQAGEVEGAADAVSDVLALPREKRIGGIIKSAKRVEEALNAAPASKARDDLQGDIEAYVSAPLVMLP